MVIIEFILFLYFTFHKAITTFNIFTEYLYYKLLVVSFTGGIWTAFLGAILGGIFTLSGVLITIHFENKRRKEEKAIQYKPILDVKGINNIPDVNKPDMIKSREIFLRVQGISQVLGNPDYFEFNSNNQNSIHFNLYIKNVGRGETKDVKIKGMQITNIQDDWIEDYLLNFSSGNMHVGEIVKDEYLKIRIFLPQYLLVKKSVNHDKPLYIYCDLKITYQDMFGTLTYEYLITIPFKINLQVDTVQYPKDLDLEEIAEYKACPVNYEILPIMPEKKVL